MKITLLTLFPQMVEGSLNESMMKRAQDKGLVRFEIVNIRDYAKDKHKRVDDVPYGGGPGMIMQVEPLYEAITDNMQDDTELILMTPNGSRHNQRNASSLSQKSHLMFICGHYEGIDHRIEEMFKPQCCSIGDYVLTNGAIAAAVVIDSVVRLLPGVLGNNESVSVETFSDEEYIEYPQYTRPREFKGYQVPDVLLGGNHKEIEKWRENQSLLRRKRWIQL